MLFKQTIIWLMGVVMGLNGITQDAHANTFKEMPSGVIIKDFSGPEAKKYFREIADIRIGMFKEYPYLYLGSYEYEQDYLDIYFKSENSRILLVFDGHNIVGFSNAIPLNEEMDEIQAPFVREGRQLSDYLYIGEVMIFPSYRGQGVLRAFFEYHEAYAKKLGLTNMTLMTVERAANHPLKPVDYKALEPIWEHFGFHKSSSLNISLSWNQIDTGQEEVNQLASWVKTLG